MRIFVVEDDERLASVIARGLRKHSYAVDVASDGETAIFQAETNEYDLLVLDVMIPRHDGFDVCRSLRENGFAAPILFLTARDSVADRVRGLELGGDDYLVKPFDFDELVARVRALMRRRHVLRSAVLAVADLTLDTATRTASRAGRAIDLTAKEYSVLEYLMENPGRVVSRTELAEHAWDHSYDPFSNVIDVYIRRLRRKLDAGEPVPLIRTRRGAGYVLTDAPEPVDE
jgi:two-component system copper resistance phosphate regulon response regulator CusR